MPFPDSSTLRVLPTSSSVAQPPDPPFLGPDQRRVAAFSLTFLAVLGAIAMVAVVFLGLGQLISFFSGVIWPLAVAGVLALVLRPIVNRLEKLVRRRRIAAVSLLYFTIVLLVAGILLLILPPVIQQILDFVEYLPTLWSRATKYGEVNYPQWVEMVRSRIENPAVKKIVDAALVQINSKLAAFLPSLGAAGGGIVGTFAFISHVAIIPVYLFFFLSMSGDPKRKFYMEVPFVSEGVRGDIGFLISEFIGIVELFFRGQLLIGLIMGVMLSIGFTLIGLKFGLVIGLAVGLLNIVPYLGSIVGLAVTLPLAFFQPGGGWKLAALVLLVKVIVQTIEGWILTPKIMGSQTGLHPVTIILSIFFWGTAFDGILGMLLAIPLTAFVVTAWRLAKRKYFRSVAS